MKPLKEIRKGSVLVLQHLKIAELVKGTNLRDTKNGYRNFTTYIDRVG